MSKDAAKADDTVKSEITKVEDAAMAVKTHVVSAGDSLWSLAEKYLGDGKKWGEIAKANPDKDPKKLDVGTSVTIPNKQ